MVDCGSSHEKPSPMIDTPLAITRPDAAALGGVAPSTFDTWVRKRIVPPPLPGTKRDLVWWLPWRARARRGGRIPEMGEKNASLKVLK